MYYYSFNYGDFSRKVSGLSDRHKLAYLYLVSMYHEQEGPIFNELQKIAFKAGVSVDELFQILNSFFECRGDFWHDDKIDKTIKEYKEKAKTKSESGKLGAKARWNPAIVKVA